VKEKRRVNDSFGDRMKLYEGYETERRLLPLLPVICRVDGICFHAFCKDLERPYDPGLSSLMIDLATKLIQEFGADCAYTQSDEVSLGWNRENYEDEIMCGGKVMKLTSHLAAKTSVMFNKLLPFYLPKKEAAPCFDARVWNVPNIVEAANVFLWREQDATRNSIQMAARHYYSHNQVFKKNTSDLQEMLFQKGVNWNDYPNFFKRGMFIVKRKVSKPFTIEELDKLPEKHHARQNPGATFERIEYKRYGLPKFGSVTNRPEFLFCGEEPRTE